MTPLFPPLFDGRATAGADPFAAACTEAAAGCDAGLVLYDIGPDTLRAAIVFAPEVPLRQAMIMQPICGIGFQNALGAVAPPEVSLHLEWQGGLRLNGARCGALRSAAASRDPDALPSWLVVALDLHMRSDTEETGLTPDETTLAAEGCGDLDPGDLLGAWLRHTLVWINRWEAEGVRPVHDTWTGLAHGLGDMLSLSAYSGTFRGIDEDFGLLLQQDGDAQIIPLTDILEETS
ncbi:biotin/lipoate--protein ligase family protein [uncultured Roseobacter sp.]|uniref:biotin/lipoate--protein ligase family protein n=1 Tax=uncultured Roseobacter sp. TaxID=114847 RepID=UPI002628C477|nr:biotin/lipoate--protein ligase family protein [uncultured Roseobacter sp.]